MRLTKKTYKRKKGNKVKTIETWVIRDRLNGVDRIVKTICKVGELPKKQVEDIFYDYRHRVELGYINPDKKAPSLIEFRPSYLKYMYSKNLRSISRNLNCYDNFAGYKNFGRINLADISKKHIMDYKSSRLFANIAEATIDRELAIIRSVFNIAKELYNFSSLNPISGKDMYKPDNKKERILRIDEENKLLNSSPPHLANIITFALNSGCRKSEITSLKWQDIKLESESSYVIIKPEHSKNKKSRRIPLNRTLMGLLSNLYKTKKGSYVFMNSLGNPFHSSTGIDKAWRTARTRAGLHDFRFHDLRHSFCSRLVNLNVPLMQVSELAGHRDISTTQRYSHVKNELKGAVLSLDKYRETA